MKRRSFFSLLTGAIASISANLSASPSFEVGQVIRAASSSEYLCCFFPIGARCGDLMVWSAPREVIPGRLAEGFRSLAGICQVDMKPGRYGFILVKGNTQIMCAN